jgi:hypothetical protein
MKTVICCFIMPFTTTYLFHVIYIFACVEIQSVGARPTEMINRNRNNLSGHLSHVNKTKTTI